MGEFGARKYGKNFKIDVLGGVEEYVANNKYESEMYINYFGSNQIKKLT